MSDGTHIEWTDASWNPLRARRNDATPLETEIATWVGWHCERVSPGCQNCYAEKLNEKRFGTGLPYNRKSRDQVELFLDEAALTKPLHWRKPRKVFVCSMTDLFGEWVPDEWIDRVFAVMALSPQHTFQVLTKRPERMRAYLAGLYAGEQDTVRAFAAVMQEGPDAACLAQDAAFRWSAEPVASAFGPFHPGRPLPNVWLGTSVEDQQRADERIPELLATPAAVRFLSCEPLLGPVSLDLDICEGCATSPQGEGHKPPISWVIVGGESGPGARPCDVGWVRSIVAQCQAAETAVFVKQLGAKPYSMGIHDHGNDEIGEATVFDGHRTHWKLANRKGGDMAEWPEDLRVREFPR